MNISHMVLVDVLPLNSWKSCMMSGKSSISDYTCAGVGTKIDPTLCRADRMVGQVLGAVGCLPDIYIELEISYFLLRRRLGVRTEGDKKGAKVRTCGHHTLKLDLYPIYILIGTLKNLGPLARKVTPI